MVYTALRQQYKSSYVVIISVLTEYAYGRRTGQGLLHLLFHLLHRRFLQIFHYCAVAGRAGQIVPDKSLNKFHLRFSVHKFSVLWPQFCFIRSLLKFIWSD